MYALQTYIHIQIYVYLIYSFICLCMRIVLFVAHRECKSVPFKIYVEHMGFLPKGLCRAHGFPP